MATPYLDRLPAGWLVAEVLPEKERGRDWAALMVHPNDFCDHDSPAPARQGWFRIPGKHHSQDAARKALKDMMATRH
jgi:hypothetical protein